MLAHWFSPPVTRDRLTHHASTATARDTASQLTGLTDDEFATRVKTMRAQWSTHRPNDHVLPAAIAIEAIRRRLGLTPYDVQVQAAIAIANGTIAEMQTGEGKTITGAIAAIIHAIESRHVHVATANEYLAFRDWQSLAPVFDLVGITTGHSAAQQTHTQKQAAYRCDVVFATGHQFGFDYLRDQSTLRMKTRPRLGENLLGRLGGKIDSQNDLCQRGYDVAIIDEVDSVLLDEAMTPLVLSGPDERLDSQTVAEAFDLAAEFTNQLILGVDYDLDQARETVRLNPSALDHASEYRRCHADVSLTMPWVEYIHATLQARHRLRRDVDYVVRNGEIQIVDAATGRIESDRQWRGGLHQAVETKESTQRTIPRRTICRISRQRYFAKYHLLSGMTGTASGHSDEWRRTYGLHVCEIPTRVASRRIDEPTIYTATWAQKIQCVVDETIRRHAVGQPILIGTRTIAQSRTLSLALMAAGINHRLLNGVQDEVEAELIASAGRSGSVMVATNMAGRGTDIVVDESGLAAGGLHVIGIERNLSTRLDRQLIGRAARQGQPGSSRFYVNADDELIAMHDLTLRTRLSKLSQPQINPAWDERVRRLQERSDARCYLTRQQLANQEEWLNELRQYVA